ncbi:MAG: hypothetical protein HZA89_08735 [Verrucomicrobia bacterium]|nr:hypothetical protein [Verrucomicrobiota bacterium]
MKHNAAKPGSRRWFLKTSAAALCGGAVVSRVGFPQAVRAAPGRLVSLSHNPGTGAYDFETAQMSGSIQPEGPYHGVTHLVDKRIGRELTDKRYSALNLFRLFSVNLGMGTPRSMERKVKATDTAVEITWPATEAHQGEITARYEVRDPDAIDLTMTLRVRGTYAGYELLLPSYFDKTLIPHVYLKRRAVSTKPTDVDLVVPMFNEVFRGCGLVFPRDAHAARRPFDGRWERSEYKMPTAPFLPVRHYAHPLAFMTDAEKKLAVVLMMRRERCSAISARYFSERDEERATSYSAFDFLVFGDDLLPGDTRTAKIRLALTPLDAEMSQPLKLHQKFLDERDGV